MESAGYINGKIVALTEAKVSVQDIGLLRGFGLSEVLRTFHHQLFRFADHMARFRESAAALQLRIPASDDDIRGALAELIERNIEEGKEAVARLILTGGMAKHGIEFDPQTPTFYILVEEMEPLPQELYEKGCTLLMHEHLRVFAEHKTTNYITAVMLQEERKRVGALEILYTHQGRVLECATSNFFIVQRGTIITPKADVLFGVTRNVAMELARKEFPVEERDITVDEMYAADEAFLTASIKGVVPVVDIGGRKIASGSPGPVTKRIMELFRAYTGASGT